MRRHIEKFTKGNKMIINLDEIEELLNSDVTGYRIGQETSVKQQNYDRYKKGLSSLESMPLKTAIELQNYINQEEKSMTKYIVLRDLLDESGDPYDNEEELKTDNYEEAKKAFEDLVKQIKSYDQKRNGASLMELNEFEEYETLECYVYG